MTVGELIRMPAERKVNLYNEKSGFSEIGAINTENETIEDTINSYVRSPISLDDMEDLQQDLLAVGI